LGEYRYRELHAFLTLTLDESEWSASRPGRFTQGKEPPVSIAEEAGCSPEPVWTRWRGEKIPAPAGN